MGRTVGRLTALRVGRIKEAGYYPDGGGLYLQVTSSGGRSWLYCYTLNGRQREMGLGAASTVSLARAREKADECRRQCQAGIDPIEARRAERDRARLDAANAITFDEAAKTFIASHRAGWRNAKHAAQWENTLKTYTGPKMGSLSIRAIDTTLVLKVLEPIWTEKPETAGRVRGRIERVLDWAAARGLRSGENPARWRGHLDKLLPARSKIRRVKHHAALPYEELPDFMAELVLQEGIAAAALEFTILTCARTGETIGASWCEIDISNRVWTIPPERMKAGKEHRVPLCDRALAILAEMRRRREGSTNPPQNGTRADVGFVFPGGKRGRPLSNMAMAAVLRRMERDKFTVHGFRSTFRDWAAECTNLPNHVVEMALAHTISDKVEAAYRRGDLFEKRQQLAVAWEEYCALAKTPGAIALLAARYVDSLTIQ
jgi:integrase